LFESRTGAARLGDDKDTVSRVRAEDYISLRQILATIEHEISQLLPAGDVKPDLGGGGSSTEVIGFGEPGPRPNQP